MRYKTSNLKYVKLFEWTKLISITGGAQIVVQLAGLLSGILIIRLLPTKEYALYTLANTMLGTMTLLADGGISSGVMAIGGKVWRDSYQLGSVLKTGIQLRQLFAVASLLIAMPILIYLLRSHEASWLSCLLIVAALIPAFFSALSDSLLEIPFKLHQDTSTLQKNQLKVSLLRFAMACIGVFILPFTYIALLANGLPRIMGNIWLRKKTGRYADPNSPNNTEIRKDILKIFMRISPGVVYYCLSGQITIWLISVFGSTKSLAEIGALGRLGALLTLFTVMFDMLLQPRFARLNEDKKLLLMMYLKIIATMAILTTLIMLFVWMFSPQVLWVLGEKYSGLNTELLLSIAGGCISSLLSGAIFTLYLSRGWVLNPVFSIGINISAIILGAYLIDLSTLQGILIFNIFVAIIQAIMNNVYIFVKICSISQ